jgi:hypothetical protein
LFFIHPQNPQNISHLLKIDSINIPVVFDMHDELNTLNRFPTNQDFQTFLLDENNKVLFIGNPVNNRAIRELYLTEIRGGSHQTATPAATITQIEVSETVFDLGSIPKGEAKEVSVSIKNVGESPYIIYDARVSCGCTKVEYEKQPLAPNGTTELKITYNADDEGRFDRTVSIYGNTEHSPLVVRLRGEVSQLE